MQCLDIPTINARPGDLVTAFQQYKPGELPITCAAIKTETGFEELEASGVELSWPYRRSASGSGI